ncbi:hypothetical protein BKA82DRAFT_1005798 [Pisolithus tinctorius]|uniref:BTB domain-containing protein n=1 Tax=Pisolithus tinctorius Marx 270 TaxID=870435 RepID=A0A0C3NQQ2_PISTI|nr:hypothetical protein BKA82DRAFT_1005798 [Pisolithus tinctorius]KIN97830.1 hypothetical protein M404DRAFT_1005798 [Pisolithus tinctorius Marx 270]
MTAAPSPRHHPMFYYPDGTHVLRHSFGQIHDFRDMLGTNSNAGLVPVDGKSDEQPIVISEVTAEGFELFLSVCYNKWRPDAAKMRDETIFQLLEVSWKYQSKAARDHALDQLESRRQAIHPAKLISISLKYQIKETFQYAFSRLIPLRLNNLDCDLLIHPVWNTLIMVREQLGIHRRIVACEPPLMIHSKRCQDRRSCTNDWRQVRWNGMGWFLLDGRNPLSYADAMQQFQEVDYGRVYPDCWRHILDLCKSEKAFVHERMLIEATSQDLAGRLINEPLFDNVDVLYSIDM